MLSFPIIAFSTQMYKQGSEFWSMDEQAKTNYYFLLCKECYWCASSADLEVSNRIIECPSCNDAYIKLMPIFEKKTYRIDHNEKRGFTTGFGIKYTEECCGGLKNKVY